MRAKTYTDIDYLNAILMAFNYDGFVEDDYQLDKDFIDIILQSRCPKVNTPYHSKMGVETCTNYSIDFLDKISPKFSTRLERLIDSFHVDFEDEEESRVEVIDGSKFIRICRAKTVEDSYTLTHEAIREYNMDAINPTDNWDLTVEALSILASMLQKDYFAKMYEPPRDYKNNEANTLYDLYLKAILLDFEIKLISYHAKYDYISECLLDKLVDSYGRYVDMLVE